MFKPWSIPVVLLVTCALLLVQVMRPHLHLCLDPAPEERALHVATGDQHAEAGHHAGQPAEVEIKPVGDTRPAKVLDDGLAVTVALFIVLLLLPRARQVFARLPRVLHPRRVTRFLPPAHAPPISA